MFAYIHVKYCMSTLTRQCILYACQHVWCCMSTLLSQQCWHAIQGSSIPQTCMLECSDIRIILRNQHGCRPWHAHLEHQHLCYTVDTHLLARATDPTTLNCRWLPDGLPHGLHASGPAFAVFEKKVFFKGVKVVYWKNNQENMLGMSRAYISQAS